VADVVTLMIALAVVVGLVVLLRRNDGHSCSRDGLRFTCRVQLVDAGDRTLAQAHLELRTLRPSSMFSMGGMGAAMGGGGPGGRQRGWGEARCTIGDGGIHLLVRRGLARQVLGPCRVLGRRADEGKRTVFVVDGPPMYQLRVPSDSPCVAHLSELIES